VGAAAGRRLQGARLLYTAEDAAFLLSLSRSELFVLLKSGEIPSVKVGRLRRVPHASLLAYVERLVAEQGAAPAAEGGAAVSLAAGRPAGETQRRREDRPR